MLESQYNILCSCHYSLLVELFSLNKANPYVSKISLSNNHFIKKSFVFHVLMFTHNFGLWVT